MNNSRFKSVARNIMWGYTGNIATTLLSFVSRTVFIYTIGTVYLGINGLFANVLGMLSFTELGIGTAMNFSLYKPVVDGDIQKIKALMAIYKKAYRVIAIIVAVLGLLLVPVLPYIIKGANSIENIPIYYVIFLFNTVSSYFITYKYGLVNAEQKGYLLTNINTIFNFITVLIQMIALIIFKNFMIYLVVQALMQLIQKIATSFYLKREYPYLSENITTKIDSEEINLLKKNVKSLVLHKVGEISIYQTDNIIISAFINITTVGLVSNYFLLITSITGIVAIIFNSVTSSLGNLIATEGKDKQLSVFKIYNFLGFWCYGFIAICCLILVQPFITLWIGANNMIDNWSVLFIILNVYFVGQRTTMNNLKVAGGIFNQDKYLSLIQAVLNLVISVVMINIIGLPGVFLGTVLAGLVANIIRPIIVYREMFQVSSWDYFRDSIKYFCTVILGTIVISWLATYVLNTVTILNFIFMTIITVIIVNLIFAFMFRKSEEFEYLYRKTLHILRSMKNVK